MVILENCAIISTPSQYYLNCIVATNSFGILANFLFCTTARCRQALSTSRGQCWCCITGLVPVVAMIRCRSQSNFDIQDTPPRHATRPGWGPTAGARSCSEERSVARPGSGSARPGRKQVTCEPLCTGGRFNPRLAQAKAEMLSTRPPFIRDPQL